MSSPVPQPRVNGIALDLDPESFGPLEETSPSAATNVIRERLDVSGYLFVRQFVDPACVENALRAARLRLQDLGLVRADRHDVMIATDGSRKHVVDQVAGLPAVSGVLRGSRTVAWFDRVLGGAARVFDHTWFRFLPPGHATLPHADQPYMGRGTANLYTLWVPLMAVSLRDGPLAVLEGSHRCRVVERYCRMDVDRLPFWRRVRIRHGRLVQEGKFSVDARRSREEVGGRWLSASFEPGDAVIFTSRTLHCSIDNEGEGCRVSVDTRYQLAEEPCDPRWNQTRTSVRPIDVGPERRMS